MAPDQAQMMKMVSYVIIPLSVLVTIKMSAGLQFFFVVSAVLQYAQSALFYNSIVRRWANLPPVERYVSAGPDGKGAQMSPFSNAAGAAGTGSGWQPPRGGTVDTTARPAPSPEEEGGGGGKKGANPLSEMKDTFTGMRGKVNKYQENQSKKLERERAMKYEQKRQLEEKERYYARLQEKRLHQMEKKGKL